MLSGMEKQVLGRNLEVLLDDGPKESEKPNPFVPEPAPVGPGVRSLMRGHPAAAANPFAGRPAPKPLVPPWYLLAGDLLLLALALIVAWKSPHPLSWQRALFCAGAAALGGGLALGALFLAGDTPEH